MIVPAVGPPDARIMLVGEAPGAEEERRGEPFIGASGQLLNEMLHDAGILRSACFITNVCKERPPNNDIEEWIPKKSQISENCLPLRNRLVKPQLLNGFEALSKEISLVSPNVIVAFGNVSMWALTGKWGIKSWRGSLLSSSPWGTLTSESLKVIPIYHPAYILRDYEQRHISIHDLRRAKRESQSKEIVRPNYSFVVRPNYDQAKRELDRIRSELYTGPQELSIDIETRAGHIACIGLGWSPLEAICIPFMCVEREEGYWSDVEECALIRALKDILTHPNARVIGQNFIYDSQYIWRHWGFVPRFVRDTMLGHHSCFSGLPKGLDYLSSLYCAHHLYWKDEGKEWNTKIPEEEYWAYNCKDSVSTYEADKAIQESVAKLGLQTPHDFQQAMFWPVLQAMIRGVKVDIKRRNQLSIEVEGAIRKRQEWLEKILIHPINVRSPPQLKKLFYGDLQQKEIFNRKTGTITLNDEALQKIGAREPILRPIVKSIAEQRSLRVFASTFLGARLDRDGRLRCSYNIAGTATYRLSSSENAFGSGLNLQNVPEGDNAKELPNVKRIFVPDTGYTFFDGDLDRADLQVVAWEAEDEDLKAALRSGVDMHLHSARAVYDLAIADDELFETHPNYPEVKARFYSQRQNTRQVVHATNYVGSAFTVAANFGLRKAEVEKFQRRWFELHPGIKKWHERVLRMLNTKRYVENRFGYRRYFFDRIDQCLPEAVAWIPQSTVAHYINMIWLETYYSLPEVQILLQVHDSLAGQFPTEGAAIHRQSLLDIAGKTVVPYEDPLIIPFRIKTSPLSWGDCQ